VKKLRGVLPPVPTAIHEDETLDEQGMRNLINHVIDGGVSGIFLLGTMGEGYQVPPELKRPLVQLAVDQVKGRVPVMVGIGDTSTRRMIRNAQEAEAAGADAIVPTCTLGVRMPDQRSIVALFEGILAGTEKPLFLYDNPHVARNEIAFETVLALADNPRIVGIKDATSDWRRFARLARVLHGRDDFGLFQGDERVLDASLLMGCDGFVAGIATLVPRLCVDLYEAGARADRQEAWRLQEKLIRVFGIYGLELQTVFSGMKYGLELLGLCQRHCIRPTPPISEEDAKHVEAVMRQEGLLG